ncbi:hypothetical protein ACSBLW_08160 [Thioclava sp. FR2]|uniref:hypothetical protein n=1 Tax=Thioclava sp. FR2 TaxID=3445780 RepID=UPI003EBA6D27
MRLPALLTVSSLALAACGPTVPDSGAGAGYNDYNAYLREREAAAARPQPIVPPGFSTDVVGAAIDRADGGGLPPSSGTGAVIGATPTNPAPAVVGAGIRPRGNAPSNIKEESGEMVHATGSASISDENDFQAVSQRETIASDKERIERNRSQYVVIQPGALPTRPGELGPNIVDYALATTNPVGTQLYKRSSFGIGNSAAKCANYASPDLAQTEFLAKGGPERDRLGLDPDGDGYACGWDPSPFRLR